VYDDLGDHGGDVTDDVVVWDHEWLVILLLLYDCSQLGETKDSMTTRPPLKHSVTNNQKGIRTGKKDQGSSSSVSGLYGPDIKCCCVLQEEDKSLASDLVE
jgi:hypothetical protein